VEGRVNEYLSKAPPSPLDVLFLSHMHNDHVSGLPDLLDGLKKNGGVKKAVLPYLYPSERSVILAYAYDTGPVEDWYFEFLRSPEAWLRGQEVEEVYFVRGGDGPEGPSFEDIPPIPERPPEADHEAITSLTLEFVSQSGASAAVQDREASAGVEGPKQVFSSGSKLISPCWFFLLFNKEPDKQKLRCFQNKFDQLRGGRNLEAVLHEKGIQQELKKAYKSTFGEAKLNDTSLAVLSAGHLNRAPGSTSCVCFTSCLSRPIACGPWSSPVVMCPCPCQRVWDAVRSVGVLYTGDLPVNKVWDIFSKKFGVGSNRASTCVCAYQVPHHGSKNNWHEKQAEILRPTLVVSARASQGVGSHPHAQVLRDIARLNRPIVWVHEQNSFRYRLEVPQ